MAHTGRRLVVGTVNVLKKYRGWIIAAAVVAVVIASQLDKPKKSGQAGGSTSATPTSSTTASLSSSAPVSPSVSPSAAGSLNWSEESTEENRRIANVTAESLIRTYEAVCSGKRVATAAAYAGGTHPMVIVGPDPEPSIAANWEYDVASTEDFKYATGHSIPAAFRPGLVNQVQLVACVTVKQVIAESCGTYTRTSDNVSGELRTTKGTATIRVVVARTGAEVARTTLERPAPACPKSVGFQVATTDPPWALEGEEPGMKQAYSFLVGVAIGPA